MTLRAPHDDLTFSLAQMVLETVGQFQSVYDSQIGIVSTTVSHVYTHVHFCDVQESSPSACRSSAALTTHVRIDATWEQVSPSLC